MKLRSAVVASSAAMLLATPATYAQSVAQQVITGYLTTSGCPSYTPPGAACFIQYGAAGSSTISGTVNVQQSTTTSLNGQVVALGGTALIGNVGSVLPAGATQALGTSTGTTASVTATLSAVSGQFTYLCGYSVRANATSATTSAATITGLSTTLSFEQWTAPAASGLGINEQIFSPCLQSSAASTSISINAAAPGSGGIISAAAWGYTK